MSGEEPSLLQDPVYELVDGFPIPHFCPVDVFRSALQYKPRDDDVFIVTYPKSGTTWTKQIMQMIFTLGKPAKSPIELVCEMPFLELLGAEVAGNIPKPGVLVSHLPFHLIPWSDKAKYIYVTRNPKDVCVSYYHHMKYYLRDKFNGTFNQFFELFMSGKVTFGDYFDHLTKWHEHRNDPNVLFMSYEEMKENPEAAVLTLASFIDEEKYAKPLREDPEKMQNVLKLSSFKYLKENLNQLLTNSLSMTEEEINKSDLSNSLKKFFIARLKGKNVEAKAPFGNFLRKATVGDWKNYFNEDQSKRMDQKIAERSKDRDL